MKKLKFILEILFIILASIALAAVGIYMIGVAGARDMFVALMQG